LLRNDDQRRNARRVPLIVRRVVEFDKVGVGDGFFLISSQKYLKFQHQPMCVN
jgi:hypothetical protein